MSYIIPNAHDPAGESHERAGRSLSDRRGEPDPSRARPRREPAQSLLRALCYWSTIAPVPLVTPLAHDPDNPSDKK